MFENREIRSFAGLLRQIFDRCSEAVVVEKAFLDRVSHRREPETRGVSIPIPDQISSVEHCLKVTVECALRFVDQSIEVCERESVIFKDQLEHSSSIRRTGDPKIKATGDIA